MIALLLRRDLFRFTVPAFWALGALYGTVMAAANNEDFLLGYGPQDVHPAKTFMEWSLITTLLICGCTFGSLQAFRVATPLQRALPIDARALFWTRMLITLSAMLGGALIACAAFALQYEHPLHPLQISLAVNAIALVPLVPFLFHSARVERGLGMPWYLFAPLLLGLVWLGV